MVFAITVHTVLVCLTIPKWCKGPLYKHFKKCTNHTLVQASHLPKVHGQTYLRSQTKVRYSTTFVVQYEMDLFSKNMFD